MNFYNYNSLSDVADLLERLKDYMDNYADAEPEGEAYTMMPNREMTLSVEISEAIEYLDKLKNQNNGI